MMLTGYTEMNVAVDAINRGEIYRLITKPWNDDELRGHDPTGLRPLATSRTRSSA